MFRSLAVAGYRSLRDVAVRLGHVTVVTGENGSGKSSLYRSLRLLADCALGEVVGALAHEGGLASALWAGPESLAGARRTGVTQPTLRSKPLSIKLGIGADGFSYMVDLGLPTASNDRSATRSAFIRDPELKREAIWGGPVLRTSTAIARRTNGLVEVREEGGPWQPSPYALATHESMLSDVPEARVLRDGLSSWRFYDALRTDSGAPARKPQIGTRTWAMASDGSDVAAAVQTIIEFGREPLDQFIDDAFPGSRVRVQTSDEGVFELTLQQPGMLRPLSSAEFSDGTLRYLMLLAALTAPKRPPLMAINEPENSLHPSLLGPLGRLIADASADTQIVLVTHSQALVEALAEGMDDDGLEVVELRKDMGETVVSDQGLLAKPQWEWGER